jgi:hypothetical protein
MPSSNDENLQMAEDKVKSSVPSKDFQTKEFNFIKATKK